MHCFLDLTPPPASASLIPPLLSAPPHPSSFRPTLHAARATPLAPSLSPSCCSLSRRLPLQLGHHPNPSSPNAAAAPNTRLLIRLPLPPSLCGWLLISPFFAAFCAPRACVHSPFALVLCQQSARPFAQHPQLNFVCASAAPAPNSRAGVRFRAQTQTRGSPLQHADSRIGVAAVRPLFICCRCTALHKKPKQNDTHPNTYFLL